MEKTYSATQKYIQMTPRKLRLVADAVRKMNPVNAMEVLPYSARYAAEPLMKTIKTAVSNAKHEGADETKLVFEEIQITQGPALKRGIAVSRGQWHPIKKRMSHIRVVVKEGKVVSAVKTQKVEEQKEAAVKEVLVESKKANKKK